MIGRQTVGRRMKNGTKFTTYVPEGTTNLSDRPLARNVKVSAEPEPPAPGGCPSCRTSLPLVIFVGLWLFILNQMQGAAIGLVLWQEPSQAPDQRIKVTFEDMAGLDEAKEELKKSSSLKQPKRFIEVGGEDSEGVLLVGPPGTGKTLLARAVAEEGAFLQH